MLKQAGGCSLPPCLFFFAKSEVKDQASGNSW